MWLSWFNVDSSLFEGRCIYNLPIFLGCFPSGLTKRLQCLLGLFFFGWPWVPICILALWDRHKSYLTSPTWSLDSILLINWQCWLMLYTGVVFCEFIPLMGYGTSWIKDSLEIKDSFLMHFLSEILAPQVLGALAALWCLCRDIFMHFTKILFQFSLGELVSYMPVWHRRKQKLSHSIMALLRMISWPENYSF